MQLGIHWQPYHRDSLAGTLRSRKREDSLASATCLTNAISNNFVQRAFCPPTMLFFGEAAAQGNNNNSNSIVTTTIIIPAADVLFGSAYRPNISHKLISVDRLNHPLRQVQFLHFMNEAIEAQQTLMN